MFATRTSTPTSRVVTPVGRRPIRSMLRRGAFTTQETTRSFGIDNQAEAKFDTGPFATHVSGRRRLPEWGRHTLNGQPSGRSVDQRFQPGLRPDPSGRAAHDRTTARPSTKVGFYAQDQIKFDRWVALLGTRRGHRSSHTDSFSFAQRRQRSRRNTTSPTPSARRCSTSSTTASRPIFSTPNPSSRPPARISSAAPSARPRASRKKPASSISRSKDRSTRSRCST